MAATNFSGPVVSAAGFTTGQAGQLTDIAAAYVSVTAGHTCTYADHDKTLFLADAASGDVTLPVVTLAGFRVRVVCGFAITTSSAVLSAEGDNISGTLVVNGATVLAEVEDQINFILNLAEIGDYVDFVSDGTKWIVSGMGGAAGSVTATDPA